MDGDDDDGDDMKYLASKIVEKMSHEIVYK